MITTKTINVPIFLDNIIVHTYETKKEIVDKYDVDINDSTEAFVFRNNKGITACFNVNHITTSVIIHECVHIVNFIFKMKGIDLCPDNDETQAYLTDWVFTKINKHLTK